MLFGEPLTMRMMIATVVVIVGVFLIVSAGGPEPERRTHHPMTSGHRHKAASVRDCSDFLDRQVSIGMIRYMVAGSMVASVLFKILNKSHAVMLRDRLQPSGPNRRRHHSEQCP